MGDCAHTEQETAELQIVQDSGHLNVYLLTKFRLVTGWENPIRQIIRVGPGLNPGYHGLYTDMGGNFTKLKGILNLKGNI